MTIKLNPEFKTKWLAALRSGDFEQGRDFLAGYGKFCCLGVGCVVLGIGPEGENGNLRTDQPAGFATLAWDGETTNDFEYEALSAQCDLARMNDAGKTFLEIADIIEARH